MQRKLIFWYEFASTYSYLSAMRIDDLAARMGGDEFVLLLPGMSSEDAALKRLDLSKAVAALTKDFPAASISISMGSATFPEESQNIEQLMALADRRMYWHKREFHAIREAGVLVS